MNVTNHYLISAMIFSFFGFSPIESLLLGFIGLFPDLDYFLPFHRGTLHNVFVIGSIMYGLWIFDISMVIGLVLAVHIVADVFFGGVALLTPKYDSIYLINFSVGLKGIKPLIKMDLAKEPLRAKFKKPYGEPLPEGIANSYSIVFLILFLFSLVGSYV